MCACSCGPHTEGSPQLQLGNLITNKMSLFLTSLRVSTLHMLLEHLKH